MAEDLAPEERKRELQKQYAAERFIGAIHRAHHKIQSKELLMRKWLINRPLYAELFVEAKPTLVGFAIKAAIGAGAIAAMTHFALLIAPAAAAGSSATAIGSIIGGALMASRFGVARKIMNVGFLGARAWDSFKFGREMRKIDNAAWFDQNVMLFKDHHSFVNTKQFVHLCKKIVEDCHSEKTSGALTDGFKLTKQHEMWAVDLAIRATEAAHRMKAASHAPVMWQCLNTALTAAPWATKTITVFNIVDKTEQDPTAVGQFTYKIDYKSKADFSRKPTIIDSVDFRERGEITPAAFDLLLRSGMSFSPLNDRRTRLESISARFENKVKDNAAYQRLMASPAPVETSPTGGGRGQSVLRSVLGQTVTAGQFCAQKLLLTGPGFLSRMIDRWALNTVHFANRTELKFRVSKLNFRDDAVRVDYSTLRSIVEKKYRQMFAGRVRKDHPHLSDEALAINEQYCVAQTITLALERKLALPTIPLETIINGTIKEACLEDVSEAAHLQEQIDALEGFGKMPKESAPFRIMGLNLDFLKRPDKGSKNDSMSI